MVRLVPAPTHARFCLWQSVREASLTEPFLRAVCPDALGLIEGPLGVQSYQFCLVVLKEFKECLAHDTITIFQVGGALLTVVRKDEDVPVVFIMDFPSLVERHDKAVEQEGVVP